MDLVESFVRNPVKVAVGVLLVALFGIIALFRIPMQLTPEVQTPTITVETIWPGASPQEVEREIVQEQEEQLRSVEGLTKLSSECLDSLGRITLEFAVGLDMTEALLKVNSRLQQVPEYPEDAEEPVLTTASSSSRPIAWFILRRRVPTPEEIQQLAAAHPELPRHLEPALRASSSGLRLIRLQAVAQDHPEVATLFAVGPDVATLRRFAEDVIESRFERVPGVSNATVLGGREEELQVIIDPKELAARRLTILDVRNALRSRNQDTSGGDFWEGKRRYVVRTLGQLQSPAEVAELVLARRDGKPVYVRDVAQVRLGFKKPDGLVRNFGNTALAINCVRETGANVLDVMEGLRAANAELNRTTLQQQGLMLEQVYDETEYIDSAVGLVEQNIVVGGILTILVLLLFLRSGRSTLILALAIPTSIVGTFLVLALLGRSLNVVSLAGLAFAVGMLVDNSVVVLENIFRHHERGQDALNSAVRGTSEVWGAVVASTLTTLAVFIPILFVEEEAGQLFRDIALAISSAVGLSLLVSAIVIPAAAARLFRGAERRLRSAEPSSLPAPALTGERGRLGPGILLAPIQLLLRLVDALGARFVRHVVGVNAWIQRRVRRQLGVSLLLVASALGLTARLVPKVEYLPAGNRNLVFGIVLPPPGYNLDELVALGERIEAELRPCWDVDVGTGGSPDNPLPIIGDFFYVARGRQVFIGLRSADPLRAAELIPVLLRAASGVPGTFVVAKQTSLFEEGLSAGRTVDVEITGPDLVQLVAAGRGVLGRVREVLPRAQVFPRPSLDLSNPEVHVVPRWDQAADLGMTAADLGYAVDALVDGAYATDYFIGGDKIDLTIMGQERFASRTQQVEQLPLVTPSGQVVPLGALARVSLASGPEQINHRERQRTITIEVSPPSDVALEDAMERIAGEVVAPLRANGALPETIQVNLSGTADKLRATWQALRFNVVLAILITYLLMAALFESWLYPMVVIFSVPLGAVGGFLGLRALNTVVPQPMDVLTMLGFVILIGTVVNNAILIVHQSLNHLRQGQKPEEAILESLRTRIRPIFMTTLTTCFALIPLVVYPGAGSELYRGLGSVLLGGLAVSSLFTLVLVPTLFHLQLSGVQALRRLLGREEQPAATLVLPEQPPPSARS